MYEIAKTMYLNGESMMSIERQIGFPRKKLSRLLKNDGVLRKFHDGSSLISNIEYEDKEHYEIAKEYISGSTVSILSKEYKTSEKDICRILHYHKVEIRKPSDYAKYTKDYTIFEKIDTEEKAYWLGFLYADGYVSNDSVILELTLAEKDKNHLNKFKKFMKTDAPINKKVIPLGDKKHVAYRLNVCSNKICEDLKALGCINNKSLVLKFPDETIVSENLLPHFMRGYFDGDGSVFISRKQKHFGVIGNKDFILDYQDKLIEKLGLNKNKLSPEGQAYSIRYGGNNIYAKIKNYLYKDATIYLERKLL